MLDKLYFLRRPDAAKGLNAESKAEYFKYLRKHPKTALQRGFRYLADHWQERSFPAHQDISAAVSKSRPPGEDDPKCDIPLQMRATSEEIEFTFKIIDECLLWASLGYAPFNRERTEKQSWSPLIDTFLLGYEKCCREAETGNPHHGTGNYCRRFYESIKNERLKRQSQSHKQETNP